MLRRLTTIRHSFIAPHHIRPSENPLVPSLLPRLVPLSSQFYISSRHFIDLHKMTNKEAIEKEKARLSDELSRGYFADISEIRKNGGKIAMANKTLIPSLAAVKFPELEVHLPGGDSIKLPITSDPSIIGTNEKTVHRVSLLCLSFRASSQKMAESWSVPFLDTFDTSAEVQIYEVSFVDSWLLSLGLVRQVFLKMMNKSASPRRQLVYSFGDHYYLRKKLQILNLLTGYIFLLDRFGKIRWQGFGSATEGELSSLLSCTSLLLEEE